MQGRKLKDRLTKRVKDEQGHMKEYLHELAEQKVRAIQNGLGWITQTLSK